VRAVPLTFQERLPVMPLARKIFQFDRETHNLWEDIPRFDDLPAMIRTLYYEQAFLWRNMGIFDVKPSPWKDQ